MNIYHLHQIIDYHKDWSRCGRLETEPNLGSFIKEKVKDVLWELERADYDDPDAAKTAVCGGISQLADFEKDITDEVKGFFQQESSLEGMIDDMGNQSLAVLNDVNLLTDLIKSSGADTPIIHVIMERLNDISSGLNEVLCSQSTRLSYLLENSGWNRSMVEHVDKLLGTGHLYMEIIAEESSTDRMVFGLGEWLRYRGSNVAILLPGGRVISIDHDTITSFVGQTDKSAHKWSELFEYFTDWMNPTPAELSVYTMATDKVWDIYEWRDILKTKANSKP